MNKKLFKNIDLMAKSYDVPSRLSMEDAWDKMSQKLEEEPKVIKTRYPVRINLVIGSMAAAAVFLIIFYLGMFNTGKYSPEIFADNTKTEFIYLPDSSLVSLNLNSNFKYHYNKFTGERNVIMNGEAYFDIQKGRKFTVDFNGGSIKVLGTEFNVVAYSNEYLNVDCTEGKVQFIIDKNVFKLVKGQGVKMFRGKVTGPYNIEPSLVKERMNGLFYWDKVSVDELIHLIGYRFGYDVKIDNETARRNFSGKIDLSNLHNGLNIVSYAMDLKYSIDEEALMIIVNAK